MDTDKDIALALELHRKRTDLTNLNEAKWLSMLLQLLDFKKQNGHCKVPAKYPKNTSLGRWVRKQRYNHHIGKLAPDRHELLKLSGFVFRLLKMHDWEKTYLKLSERLRKKTFEEIQPKDDGDVYYWMMYQRKLYWKGKLQLSKVEKLRRIGVDMRHRTMFRFEEKFRDLKVFKEKNGHCYACRYFGADDTLINFVKGLRRSRESMNPERIKLLDGIGFDWNPHRKVTTILNKQRALQQSKIFIFPAVDFPPCSEYDE